jgi:glucokinase
VTTETASERPPVVVLDVGGTKIAANVASGDGTLLLAESLVVATPSGDLDSERSSRDALDVVRAIHDLAQRTATAARVQPAAIGVAMPGPCKQAEQGIAFNCQNIWSFRESLGGVPTDVAAELAALCGLPVVAENDANAFVIGEQQFGAAVGEPNVLGVIYGTGIGGGVVADGNILHTNSWNAGEIHQIPLSVPRELAVRVVGEEAASKLIAHPSGAFVRIGMELLLRGSSLTKLFGCEPSQFSSDPALREEVIEFVADWMSWGLASVLQTTSASVIVIGGGLGKALGDDLARSIELRLCGPGDDPLCPNFVAANGRVAVSQLGAARAALLGVASRAWAELS